MTNQETQQLIDRYLQGITTPDEERQLARELLRPDTPSEWQAVRLMLGELAMDEAAYDAIMERRQPAAKVVGLRRRWWWVAAACLVAVLSLHFIYNNKQEKEELPILAQQLPTQQENHEQTFLPSLQGEGLGVGSVTKTAKHMEKAETPPPTPFPTCGRLPVAFPLEGRGATTPQAEPEAKPIYAAYAEKDDSADYLPPARVDEFIGKLANYHHIEATVLTDSTAHSVAYVFPDNDKVRLFDRLLQVACSYHYDSPGYQMTISQQQLLFTLEDTRLSCRYLWLAERIGGSRIILYATHAPTGAAVSSEAYQEFRERTTHTNQTTEL
ncbi:MAG: hypothetical protein II792_10260 [Prevotella sp.]|nr:hypothetical protein [Prevotella sp.]